MAEKKFFVDINLQGSALKNAKIGTNSSIGSTEGAFGFDSASHRLQYFDGTATKDVANLSDISAVTGGLIFQGGYDPTTDTPDITDGTALKGFLWVATSAGTFLGESVQVGDSIVAKVDNAGATIADWLILQGNIVIATDSVDGISRLATQTEANTGTEGGAVVITPATLQGKIDAQITPEISSKLPLAGGTMTGPIDMAGNYIDGVQQIVVGSITNNSDPIEVYAKLKANSGINIQTAPTDIHDAVNKGYVDNVTSDKLPLTGGTMSGNIDMANSSISNVNSLSVNDLSNDDGNITLSSNLNVAGGKIINLPVPTDSGDAANKDYVDGAASTAQANAEATASADASEKANAAETDAKQYADSLAPNYDAAGSAAQALTDANAYTDTGLAAKLNLAGGDMSGAINMNGYAIYGANTLAGDEGHFNSLLSSTGSDIKLIQPLNFQNSARPINLAAPTDGGDATNKTYVDGAAATAESNANDYTDTEIAAQSFSAIIAPENWSSVGDFYVAEVTHNFGTQMYSVSYNLDGKAAEFYYESANNTIVFLSNIIPANDLRVYLAKVTPPVV